MLLLRKFAADTNWKIDVAKSSAAVGVAFPDSPDIVLSRAPPSSGSAANSKPVALITLPSARDRMSVDCTFGRLDKLSIVEEMDGGSFCKGLVKVLKIGTLQPKHWKNHTMVV